MVYFFQDNNYQNLDDLFLQNACCREILVNFQQFNELPLYCKKHLRSQDEYISFWQKTNQ